MTAIGMTFKGRAGTRANLIGVTKVFVDDARIPKIQGVGCKRSCVSLLTVSVFNSFHTVSDEDNIFAARQ